MKDLSLLAFIALSAIQSSAQTRIHSAILVIDTCNNASYNQVHWLVRTQYLSIKASNGLLQETLGLPHIPSCQFRVRFSGLTLKTHSSTPSDSVTITVTLTGGTCNIFDELCDGQWIAFLILPIE